MERYNFNTIEKKMAKLWDDNKVFKTSVDKKLKILCIRNVSLSIRKNTHGHVRNYHNWRCSGSIQINARF